MEEIQIRGRGRGGGERRGSHRNKQWVAGHENGSHGVDIERWDRGGHRGGRGRGGRGRGSSGRSTPFLSAPPLAHEDGGSGTEDEGQDGMEYLQDDGNDTETNDPDDPEEKERFWKELVKARELEKKRMIAEKKWADPEAPMRLEDAITPVGTCTDMCPRFERYRREREHNLDRWEVIPGTKRVDHARAVKMYERASGSKSLPSDLRTPETCRKTLDYLFHDLLPRGGFTDTHSFIRDRSRAVRNDFTPQLITGSVAIECHDRCARFHIVAMHLQRDVPGFDLRLEEQQLSHALLSLQQFYEDQRGQYASPTELEMRVYQRLISVRNLKERHEDVPEAILSHPVFQLTTRFLRHVQNESAPISRTSSLRVGQEGMQIFGELAAVLRAQHNTVMIYLTACILERLFGKDTIEDMEAIRGALSIPDIIDGISQPLEQFTSSPAPIVGNLAIDSTMSLKGPEAITRSPTEWLNSNFGSHPSTPRSSSFFPTATSRGTNNSPVAAPISTLEPPKSAFANIKAVPNAFGTGTFGSGPFTFATQVPHTAPQSAFVTTASTPLNPIPSSTSMPSFSGPSRPNGGSIFSSDLSEKPFGTLPAAAFSAPPINPTPSPQPVASISGLFSQPVQNVAGPSASSSQAPSLNPQAPSFYPFSHPVSPKITLFPLQQQQIPPQASSLPLTTPSLTPAAPPTSSLVRPSAIDDAVSKSSTPQPHIIERRQTLWEMPGSVSLQKVRSQPVTPRVEIPSTSTGETSAPSTPTEPPPLNKPPPLQLPSTPTVRWFDPSSQQAKSGSSSSLLRKQSLIGFPLQMPSSPSNAEILSPLHIPSSGSMKWPMPNPAPSTPTPAGPSAQPPSPLLITEPLTKKAKGKSREVEVDLDSLAKKFMREYSYVTKCFRKWLKKATDHAAWQEACRRSDIYREKVHREKLSLGLNGLLDGPLDKSSSKRRVSFGTVLDPPVNKRVRRRKSSDYKAALTDEQLVQQLKENQEEHQRRWAQGSFLRTIRRCVEELSPDANSHAEWRIWLTLNTDNDGTAIWLEHKFDLPQSGEFISDSVFSIPAIPKTHVDRLSLGSPGLIVFERTPLEGVTDPLERKYRVLDDCTRLRDIVDGLTSDTKLRFLPAVLVIHWSDGGEEESSRDFAEMMYSFVQAGNIKSFHEFPIYSSDKDLDKNFEDIMKPITLEVEDRLVQTVCWHDLINVFIGPFKSHTSDWLHSCWTGDHFDSARYSDVLSAIKSAQRHVVYQILAVLGRKPQFHVETPVDTHAPAHLGLEYATGPFIDVFVKVAIATAERLLGDDPEPSARYVVSRESMSASSEAYSSTLESISARLRESGVNTLMKWTKRRADENISPSSTPKRLRPSLSGETSDTDISIMEDSPPASTLAASTADYSEPVDRPPVTAAMLRALARDILKSR